MASLRSGTREDGSTYVQVLYRLEGKQTSTSFEDMASAAKFQTLARKFGPAKAHLTGLRKSTHYDYRAYAKNDIVPILGDLPLTALSRDDIARWMQAMTNEAAGD